MRVTYEGPHDVVEVPAAGEGFTAERGKPVDVPDDVAKALLEQDTWTEARAEGRRAKAKEGEG
jgi:hypothetical protein